MQISDESAARALVEQLEAWLERDDIQDPWIYYKGRGRDPLSSKFNVVIYRNQKGRFKVVTTDEVTLEKLLNGKNWTDGRPYRVDIDDAGIGCPVGGVLIGAYSHHDERFIYDEIPVLEFQDAFSSKNYLQVAADISLALLEKLGYPPGETVVYLCTGYIHSLTKESLRRMGFEVQVTEIGPPLQELLEMALKRTLTKKYRFNGFYDPKVDDPRLGFRRAMNWIKRDKGRLASAKTGWKLFSSLED